MVMNFDIQKLTDLGITSAGILLIFLVGILCYFALKKGLKSLLFQEYITQAVFVVSKSILKWVLVISIGAIALQHLGIKVTNIMAGLLTIAGMVAIGFIAVWSILSNILCSVLLMAFRTFDIGDEIEIIEPIGGVGLKGKVVGFNVMFTSLAENSEESKSKILTQVPNNIFFQKSLRRKIGKKPEGLGKHLLSKPLPFQPIKKAKLQAEK